MTTFNLTETTFGIEFEVVIPKTAMRREGVTVGSYSGRGDQVPGLPEGWVAKSDSSIRTPDWNFAGVEIVSPKLKGAEGIAQVEEVCKWLVRMGARVNRSCGMHVHVGTSEMDAQTLARLICLTSYNETAIYAASGSKARASNHYCQSIKDKLKPAAKCCDESALRQVARHHSDRYYLLNLENIASGKRQAVEFRAFAGTTSAIKAKATIQFCLALAHKAATSKVASAWDAKPSKDKEYEGKGEGYTMMGKLLKNLGWVKPGLKPFVCGMLTPECRVEMANELLRLAAEFDKNDETE